MKLIHNEKYVEAMRLKSNGMRICDIIKILGLKRSCVNNWINRGSSQHYRISLGKSPRKGSKLPENYDPITYMRELNHGLSDLQRNSIYSFILGMYLGDGCIGRTRTKTLTIALDKKHEKLNEYVINAFTLLFNKKPKIFDRSVDRGQKFKSNSITVSMSSINIGIIFPHEGVGPKHLRKIELQEWQKEIINPVELIKGLMFSDGCYYYCNHYKHYFYGFTNASMDIIKILEYYLNLLNIRYNKNITKAFRAKATTSRNNICIGQKEDVEKLHSLIGDKTNIVHT
jgi:hypothetical protein